MVSNIANLTFATVVLILEGKNPDPKGCGWG